MIQILKNSQGKEIRYFLSPRDGSCWFCARDIVSFLLYSNCNDVLKRVSSENKCAFSEFFPSSNQNISKKVAFFGLRPKLIFINFQGIRQILDGKKGKKLRYYTTWVNEEAIFQDFETGGNFAGTQPWVDGYSMETEIYVLQHKIEELIQKHPSQAILLSWSSIVFDLLKPLKKQNPIKVFEILKHLFSTLKNLDKSLYEPN